jgi:type IV fimbrial biogenesis protein FimT
MSKSRGFTLIEVLVVIAIVGILVGLAAPSFSSMIRSSGMTSTVNTFLADMRYARSEAIRRGGGVVMCRSSNPEAVNPTCGTGSIVGWESGWIIFHDLDGNVNKAATEPLLRAEGPITAVNTITEPGPATKFKFNATGRLPGVATSILFGSGAQFGATEQRTICVNFGGRARINGDGNTYPCTNY